MFLFEQDLFAHLIAKQKKSTEKTVEVSCQDAQVDRSGTGDFDHQWHEAVQAKHATNSRAVGEKNGISNVKGRNQKIKDKACLM